MRTLRDTLPLTAAGVLVACLGVSAYLAGWRLGWVELMVLAAACALALCVAAPFVLGRIQLELDRALVPVRSSVGEPARAVLTIHNPGRVPSRPITVEDRVGRLWQPLDVGRIPAGGSQAVAYSLPTSRRGVLTIGPAVVARQDPLRLMRREVRHVGEEQFWVHPRWKPVPALSVGYAKDLEGPTSDASPSGDVAFHALREYQLGDDHRHIHWMSTARAGRPMIRHYVDNRRPQLMLLIDDRRASLDGDRFEVAMEVAASIAISSIRQDQPVSIWSTVGALVGQSRPAGRDQILDRLAGAQPAEHGDLLGAARGALAKEPSSSAVVLITGSTDARALLTVSADVRRSMRMVIVRIWPAGEVARGAVPGAEVLDVDALEGFCRAWKAMAR